MKNHTNFKTTLVWVYKSGSDASNGGVTSKHNSLHLVYGTTGNETREEVEAFFEKTNRTIEKAVVWTKRTLWGENHDYIVPLSYFRYGKPLTKDNIETPGGTTMFGGNFVYSSCSSFPGNGPVKVHDRFEDWKTYEAMSR